MGICLGSNCICSPSSQTPTFVQRPGQGGRAGDGVFRAQISAQCTVVNFIVTPEGLEDQICDDDFGSVDFRFGLEAFGRGADPGAGGELREAAAGGGEAGLREHGRASAPQPRPDPGPAPE